MSRIGRNTRQLPQKVVVAMFLSVVFYLSAQPEDLKVVYERPDVDVARYQRILVKPLNLAETRIVPPPWVEEPDPREWSLSRDNQEFLRTSFASSMRAGIEESGRFEVTTEPGPAMLQLEVQLISLTPWASREEVDVETLGSGKLTFEAHVRDAQTADLLALFQGTQNVGRDYQENTAFNKASDLTEHFTNWGRNVSRRLAARQAR